MSSQEHQLIRAETNYRQYEIRLTAGGKGFVVDIRYVLRDGNDISLEASYRNTDEAILKSIHWVHDILKSDRVQQDETKIIRLLIDQSTPFVSLENALSIVEDNHIGCEVRPTSQKD